MTNIMQLSDIKISDNFAKSIPRPNKLNECKDYWDRHHKQDRYIVVKPDNTLIDGYIMYLVLKENNIDEAEVKVSDFRRRRWRRIKQEEDVNFTDYRTEPTTYVYGYHLNDETRKEYIWRVPKSWSNFSENIEIGDRIFCRTKYGVTPIRVIRVGILDKCPVEYSVKKVAYKTVCKLYK